MGQNLKQRTYKPNKVGAKPQTEDVFIYIYIYVNPTKVGTKPPTEDKYTANKRWHKKPDTTLVYTYRMSHVNSLYDVTTTML